MADNEGARETGEAIVMCMVPDVCWTSGVPVPYQIVAKFDSVVEQVNTVRFTSMKSMTMDGRITRVMGDEAGSGGGIVSGVNVGFCRPISHSTTVRAKKSFLVYNSSFYWMNCAGPGGAGNTIGRVTYIKTINCVYVGPLGSIAGNTNPPIALNDKEVPWYEWVHQQYSEYDASLQQGRMEALQSWGSMLASAGQFVADLSPVGALDSLVKNTFDVDLPEWMPDADRGAATLVGGVEAIGSTVVSAAGFLSDISPLGDVGDLLRYQGVSLPAWAPSGDRAEEGIKKAVHAIVDPYEKLIKDGHYGQALGKAQAGAEKIAVEIIVTEGLGELAGGAELAEGLRAERTSTEALDGIKVIKSSKEIPCFPVGTKVLTKSGPLEIDSVRVGSVVASFDVLQMQMTYKTVSALLENSTKFLVDVVAADEVVSVTSDHRFWVECRRAWVPAQDLVRGMKLRTAAGELIDVSDVSMRDVPEEKTYNLSIDDCGCYFVGSKQILVHNEGEPPVGKIYVGYGEDGSLIYVGQTRQDLLVRQKQHWGDAAREPEKYGFKENMRLEEVPGMNGLTDAEMDYHERMVYDKLKSQGYDLKNRQIPLRDEKISELLKAYC